MVEMEKELLDLALRNKDWVDAFAAVTTCPSTQVQTAKVLAEHAKILRMTPDALASKLLVAVKNPKDILLPALKKYSDYAASAGDKGNYANKARETARILAHMIKTGTVGITPAMVVAETVSTAGALIKGVAITVAVGAAILVAGVVIWHGFGFAGTLMGDDPIERTWLGDPEARAAWEAEEAARVTYGNMIAITHGYNEYIDVTDESLGEYRYLYPPTDSYDEEIQKDVYSSVSYVLYTVPVLHINTGSLFSRADTGRSSDKPKSKPRHIDPVTGEYIYTFTNLADMPHIDISTIGKYKTYGEVCNAIAKIENYPKEEKFLYHFKEDCFGLYQRTVFCERERL